MTNFSRIGGHEKTKSIRDFERLNWEKGEGILRGQQDGLQPGDTEVIMECGGVDSEGGGEEKRVSIDKGEKKKSSITPWRR